MTSLSEYEIRNYRLGMDLCENGKQLIPTLFSASPTHVGKRRAAEIPAIRNRTSTRCCHLTVDTNSVTVSAGMVNN